ncbi:MAG TPA: hypothetical protein VK095_16405 [Beutenbergiaceae bacterium]|nr:hypothetical protein [Beutenbergiaceae bacterium]
MGINSEQLLILIVIAVIVIGPERLPKYAEQLARLVKQLKKMATGATEKVKEELGEEAEDLDLSQLDPRKYDPRRIVREALSEDDILPASKPARSAAARNAARNRRTGASTARSKPKPPPTRTSGSRNARNGAASAATAAGTTAVVDAAGQTEVSADGDSVLVGTPFDDEAT